MEQDVKEKPKVGVRKSVSLKKEDAGAEETAGHDKNGSTKRQHSTSTKHKSTSSPRSSSSTTPSAPLSPSSTSALSTSPPAVTETSKRRPTGSSQPSSRASSDSREPRAKGTKITAGGEDHNGAAPPSQSPSETPLKKSTRSSSSLASQLQHSPATKPKSPHPTKEASAVLEEEDDSDEDLVIDFPLRPVTQSQPSGKAPVAPASKAAGGKKETRSSGSNSNKESVEEDGSGARRRSMEASPAGAMGVAAAAGGKTEPVRRRQPTERRDRSQSARLDVRKRSHTADPRSPTGGGGGQRMSSPTVNPSKEGSHSARESTSRLARDEENDEEGQSNAGKNRRERNSQDLKKTLSTGSIRSNVEKDASAKDSKSGSKQSKSNRDLNKLCQEDKAERKKALGEASPTRPARRRTTTSQSSGAITTLRVTKRDRKDEDDRPASPGGNRSSRREGAEPAEDEGSADGKRGASAASATKNRPDSGRDKRERPRGERAKDGGDDQHQAKDSPTTTSDRRSSRPTSVRVSKGADAGSGGARKERKHDEESNGGGEDDDSSFLTSSGGITPGRESRTTSSPIDDDEEDEDSTASYTTPRDHSSTPNGGSAKSRRMSLKVRENGVSSSEDHRKRGSGGSSGRRRVGSGNREREESEEEDNKDSKTEEEQDNDGQQDSDEEVEEVEEEGNLDAETVEYNARLRKFILACVENLMTTVTRWAVVVSTPFAIAGELRVVDITRYVNGTLVILDGLKLGHRSQRSASGRDLGASKVDKSVQNPIHVAVNILLKKLLKIKNRVNTLSSKRLPRFYQAFYAVQSFHETGEAPRDNSSVHLPLKSTMSDSSIDATLVAAQFGDNPLPTPSPRPNPFEFPSGTDVQAEYMLEPMKCRIGSSGAKNRTLVLQRSNLLVFPKNRSKCKDDKPVKVHDLRNTKAISPSYVNKTATKIKPQSFCVLTVEDEELEIEAASKETMAAWALALDGLCMPNYSTHLNAQFRSELLQYVGKNVYKGGVIKSSYEEEWSYFANGTLERAEPLNGRRLAYTWDGEVLQPLRARDGGEDDCGPSLGTGRWNGVWLSWYRGDYLSEDPVIRYFWLPTEKEFQTSNPLLTWKWTRHFLASKYGSGEWIMEGEVPSPVVMCLQLMRYAAAIRAEELSRQLTAAPSVLASSRGSKS